MKLMVRPQSARAAVISHSAKLRMPARASAFIGLSAQGESLAAVFSGSGREQSMMSRSRALVMAT